MLYQVTFEDAQHAPLEVVTYAADTPREAVSLLINGTITWPAGTRNVTIQEVQQPAPAAV